MTTEQTLDALSSEERMLLMRFVCSFAWVDGRIHEAERALIARYMARLGLDEAESREVRGWLERPPAPESVSSDRVPAEHRVRFVRALESVVSVDGEITEAERSQLLQLARHLGTG